MCLPTECIFCSPPALSSTRMVVSTTHNESCGDLLGKAMQEELLTALFGEAIADGDYCLELAHLPVKYSGLALPNTANSETLNHQSSKDVCSHLISASQILYHQQLNASFSEAKKQESGCKPHKLRYVNGTCLFDMEFRDT